jgi:hypothetical protein
MRKRHRQAEAFRIIGMIADEIDPAGRRAFGLRLSAK